MESIGEYLVHSMSPSPTLSITRNGKKIYIEIKEHFSLCEAGLPPKITWNFFYNLPNYLVGHFLIPPNDIPPWQTKEEMQKMKLKEREKLRKDLKNMEEVLGWLKDKPLESCVKDLKEKERAREKARAEAGAKAAEAAVREYREGVRKDTAEAMEEIRNGEDPWKGKKDDGEMRRIIDQMDPIIEQRERDLRTLAEVQMYRAARE